MNKTPNTANGKMPEIIEALNILEGAIDSLGAKDTSLKERLNPIMGSSYPECEQKSQESPYTCDMAIRIDQLRSRLISIDASLENTLRRIQI